MATVRLALTAVAAIVACAGGAGALELATVRDLHEERLAPVVVPPPEPTPLEWLRDIRPREGRDVVVPVVGGGSVQTIEWWHPVEVRVRTESGAALTERERAAIRTLAVVCDRGGPQDTAERTERNGTFVIEYRCAWLQGFEDRWGDQ